MKFLERHPLPWVAEEKPFCDRYFVKDAKDAIVASINAVIVTQVDAEVDGCVVTSVTKRPAPGALDLAKLIAAAPRLMAAVTDAHGWMDSGNSGAPGDLVGRLEKLIEELA